MISFATDEARSLPRLSRGHVQRCASCRRLLESENDLAARLVDDSERHRRSASPFLHAKIMARLNRHPVAAAPRLELRLSAWSVAALVIAVVFAGVVWKQNMPSFDQPIARRQAERTAEELSALIRLPGEVQLPDWSRKLDQPLEAELQLVVTDAKTAITFLADSFLPEQFRDSALGGGL